LRPRNVVLAVLVVLLTTGIVVGAVAWHGISQVLPGGGITTPIDGRYNIALLGSDSATWRDGARIDSTTIASVDATTGRTLLISVPRNLVLIPFPQSSPLHALYPDGYTCPNQELEPCMLTMVYQTGLDHADLYPGNPDPGAQATVEALEGITGLTMNYYAYIDLDGLESLIDAVGGIDLTIRTRIPIGALGQTAYWIEPGPHHFNGEAAVWYIRSRVGTDDYTRMTREKCVMLAMLDQFDPTTMATRFLGLVDAAAKTAHTNIPASQINNLASLAKSARTWTVTGLNLTPPLVNPLQPDYAQITQLVAEAVAAVKAMDGQPANTTPRPAGTTPGGGSSTSTTGLDTVDLNTSCGM